MSEFERWEGRFSGPEYVFGTEPNAFLASKASLLVPGARVLSIADGEGRNGVWLAGQGLEVTAQDFSPAAQAKARALAERRGVALDFELSDLTARIWEPCAYDVVVGIFFQFLSPEERRKVFDGISRTVRPGGLVLVEGYGPKQLDFGTGGPKRLENLYTESLMHDLFREYAEVEITAYDAEVQEGAGHSGMSALVDVVARR